VEEFSLKGHADWILGLAWAPGVGGTSAMTSTKIASCAQDKTVIIWSYIGSEWSPKLLKTFDEPVWRVSWNMVGEVLAISCGENQVIIKVL
jgi:protein transport protein SEC13